MFAEFANSVVVCGGGIGGLAAAVGLQKVSDCLACSLAYLRNQRFVATAFVRIT